MLTLAFESSAKAASVALCEDERLISQVIQCSGLTHSRTLLPMAEDLLKNAETEMKQIDCFAVAHGPGSFTGIRIGIATVKGLAWAAEKPCVGVSTLASMAWNGAAAGGLVCAVMDARRSEVYNALFRIEDGRPVRLCPDRAISLSALTEELRERGEAPFLVGLFQGAASRPPYPAGESPLAECLGRGYGGRGEDALLLPGAAAGVSPPLSGRAGTPGPSEPGKQSVIFLLRSSKQA